MKSHHTTIDGTLVTLTLPGRRAGNLDGFWTRGAKKNRRLLIFVHGMGSNFYKSRFKKAWMTLGPAGGFDVFCFNNRGCEGNVADEHFRDCVADLDAALAFARAEGYRSIILLGHSTGCQKITYYWNRRQPRDVEALVLAALGDDLAIAKRDLGRQYTAWIKKARHLVARGRGENRLPQKCLGFSARRFISAAGEGELEAELFRLDGPLRLFRRVTIPVLAVFPEKEQYACIPVHEAADRLAVATRSTRFGRVIIPDADHSFHGRETACVKATMKWLNPKN